MSDPTATASHLREKQKPLKDKYRSDPDSASVTLSASGSLDTANSLTCSLSSGAASKKLAGLHRAAGGAGFDTSGELCSGDMLLESLVACFGVTVRAVSTSMGIPIHGGTITCQGDLDFRGTMGVKDPAGNTVLVGFKKIKLFVRLEIADEHRDSVDKLIQLSERYCVVLQTLKAGVNVETRLGHVGKPVPDSRGDETINETVDRNGNGPEAQSEGVIRLN